MLASSKRSFSRRFGDTEASLRGFTRISKSSIVVSMLVVARRGEEGRERERKEKKIQNDLQEDDLLGGARLVEL